MEKCQRLAAASVFSALVSLEAGRSFSALLSEASVFDSLWEEALSSLDSLFDSFFDSLCEALVDSALDSAFDSLVDADALEAELEECSERLPEGLWDELELPEEAASSLDEAEEPDVLPEEAPDEDELLLDVLERAVVVPKKALIIEKGGAYVFVVRRDSIVEKRFVETGPETGNNFIVERGLASYENIVVEGYHKLTHGMKVEPVAPREEEANPEEE